METILFILIGIGIIISFFLSALMLLLAGKIRKEKINYGKALGVAFIPILVGSLTTLAPLVFGQINFFVIMGLNVLIGIIVIGLMLTLPRLLLGCEWKQGLIIGAIWYGLNTGVSIILYILFMIVLFTFGMGATDFLSILMT